MLSIAPAEILLNLTGLRFETPNKTPQRGSFTVKTGGSNPSMNLPDDGIIPEEDSPDLTDDEIQAALVSSSSQDLTLKIVAEMRAHTGTEITDHELRRRKPHLYWRMKVQDPDGTVRSILFQADWLNRG